MELHDPSHKVFWSEQSAFASAEVAMSANNLLSLKHHSLAGASNSNNFVIPEATSRSRASETIQKQAHVCMGSCDDY